MYGAKYSLIHALYQTMLYPVSFLFLLLSNTSCATEHHAIWEYDQRQRAHCRFHHCFGVVKCCVILGCLGNSPALLPMIAYLSTTVANFCPWILKMPEPDTWVCHEDPDSQCHLSRSSVCRSTARRMVVAVTAALKMQWNAPAVSRLRSTTWVSCQGEALWSLFMIFDVFELLFAGAYKLWREELKWFLFSRWLDDLKD